MVILMLNDTCLEIDILVNTSLPSMIEIGQRDLPRLGDGLYEGGSCCVGDNGRVRDLEISKNDWRNMRIG